MLYFMTEKEDRVQGEADFWREFVTAKGRGTGISQNHSKENLTEIPQEVPQTTLRVRTGEFISSYGLNTTLSPNSYYSTLNMTKDMY